MLPSSVGEAMAEGHGWGGASRADSNHPAPACANAAPPYPRRGVLLVLMSPCLNHSFSHLPPPSVTISSRIHPSARLPSSPNKSWPVPATRSCCMRMDNNLSSLVPGRSLQIRATLSALIMTLSKLIVFFAHWFVSTEFR
jgi:hypothetical protein